MMPVITIDGPSGAGKSTVSRKLATILGYKYIDSGALYRIVALETMRRHIDENDDTALAQICNNIEVTFFNANGKQKIICGGHDISGLIRKPEISMLASRLSARKITRDYLTALQRKMAENEKIVLEGRDAGTVVFPDAKIKFFLDATPEERGKRRFEELTLKGSQVDLKQITQDIIKRDNNDRSRHYAPLLPAPDAVIIDSTAMTIDEVVARMIQTIKQKNEEYS